MSVALFDSLVLIRGAGDLGSGVAYRLIKAGFPVVMTEIASPLMVRTTVSYGTAVYYTSVIIEGIIARHVTLDAAPTLLGEGILPVLVDPRGESIRALHPAVVVDARVAKANLDTTIGDAPLVIGLGPGFTAGLDCHAVVETNRGHNLGRVIWQGSAEPDTGVPARVNGKQAERVLRAPHDGELVQVVAIGERVNAGSVIAHVDETPILAPFDGVLRGLMDNPVHVTAGLKIGDLDPRARREHCFTISDKSLAVGGGVVEAIFTAPQIRRLLPTAKPTETDPDAG
jgi:xanthine dehydrogenase accessory factor